MFEVLVVDDEPTVRWTVAESLRQDGHSVTEARDGTEAAGVLGKRSFDVVVTDIRMPGIDGLSLFRQIRSQQPATAVILMTAFARASDAVEALKEGASDYLTKPFDVDEITVRVARLQEQYNLKQNLADARAELMARDGGSTIVGRSPEMERVLDLLDAFAASDAPVLILGESGTGKELVAQRIHRLSARRAEPFVAVNCAAFPETLIEAELFGHERGAFTGAVSRRDGRFVAAHGGTLFLDEVAEVPLPTQAKLLRVLEDKVVEPIGTNNGRTVDVRILSATHQNLTERIRDGSFREDLYYRLHVLTLEIPPLRERTGDLALLVQHFLTSLSPDGEQPSITTGAFEALSRHPFPGNIRQLRHALHHALVLSRYGEIREEHLPAEIVGDDGVRSATLHVDKTELRAAVDAFEREHVIRILKRASGKKALAAELLGISTKNLWEKCRKHGIGKADYAADS